MVITPLKLNGFMTDIGKAGVDLGCPSVALTGQVLQLTAAVADGADDEHVHHGEQREGQHEVDGEAEPGEQP